MKFILIITIALVSLLSIAAGVAKVTLIPEEAEFLAQFGFSSILTMSFGAAQVLGGILLAIPATRFYGALVTAIAFAVSTVLLLAAGSIAFGGVSLLPVILAGLIAYKSFPAQLSVTSVSDDT